MFKDNLKRIREEKGMTAQDLADSIGVTRMTYSHYENRGSEPPYSILLKISQVLGVSIDFLLSDELTTTASTKCMERLPATDSMCFTPAYAMQGLEFILSTANSETLESIHSVALEKAKQTYQQEIISQLIASSILRTANTSADNISSAIHKLSSVLARNIVEQDSTRQLIADIQRKQFLLDKDKLSQVLEQNN